MQGLLRDGRTSSTVNSPMEVVHLAVGLPDMVAMVARAMRAVEGTMRAVGLSARVAAAENIISVSVSVIGGPRLVVLAPGGVASTDRVLSVAGAETSVASVLDHSYINIHVHKGVSQPPPSRRPPIRTRLLTKSLGRSARGQAFDGYEYASAGGIGVSTPSVIPPTVTASSDTDIGRTAPSSAPGRPERKRPATA